MEIEIVMEMEMWMEMEMEKSADLDSPPTYVFCVLFHKTQAAGFSFPIPKKSPAFGRTQSGHLSQLHKKKRFRLMFRRNTGHMLSFHSFAAAILHQALAQAF